MPPTAVTGPTQAERGLGAPASERLLVAGGLLIVVLSTWVWIGAMSVDMYGAMTGASRWMMTVRWDAAHVGLLFAMWAAMMVGMMLPSAAPTVLLYGRVVRGGDVPRWPVLVYLFTAGYLIVWCGFSLAAVALQLWLRSHVLLSPMMEARAGTAAVLLFVAGTYQLTAFKRSCLDQCRSPISFITTYWRKGATGALRMGVRHGLFCLGCCWALMLLLFAGGVMNLWVIAAIAAFVLLEKLAPFGAQGGRLSGVLLIAAGCWVAFRL